MTDLIDDLRKRLTDESAEVRRRAVLEIERVDRPDLLPLILLALGDADWRVRKEAAAAASKIAHRDEVIDALVAATEEEENIGLRNAALHALSVGGDKAVGRVIARVRHESADARKTAVDIIGLSKDARAVTALTLALSDADTIVQTAAAEWLGEYPGDAAGEALLSCLGERDSLVRLVALQSLEKIGAEVTFETLSPLLNDPLLDEVLVPILGASGAPEAVAEVARRLSEHPDASLAMERLHDRNSAMAALVEQTLAAVDDRTHAALWRYIDSATGGDSERAAIRCMLWMKQQSDIAGVISLARNSESYPVLVDGLSGWGEPAVTALKAHLGTETEHRLASVIGLLSRLLDEQAGRDCAAAFEALLDGDHPAVITAAASAVARFSDAEVAPKLLDLIQSDSERVRNAAGAALLELSGKYPDAILAAIRTLPIRGKAGVQLCRVLAAVGGDSEVASVSDAVMDEDSELRRCALRALARLKGSDAVDKVALALSDPDLSVRMAAVDALTSIGEAAREAIAAAIPTAKGPVAPALIRALGKVGCENAAEILFDACKRSGDVALAAIEAAGKLGIPRDSMPIDLFNHPDKEVVKTALRLFGSYLPDPPLIDLITHPEWDVRLAATNQVGDSVPPSPAILSTLKAQTEREENDLVRDALSQAIKKSETPS